MVMQCPRALLLACVMLLSIVSAFAQPVITSISPVSASKNTTLTISGTGFNATAANNIVLVGGVKATVKSASATSLTVAIPAGISNVPVSVTNGILTAYSKQLFNQTFPTCDSLKSSTFAYNASLTTGNSPVRILTADFDQDGKPDLVTVNKNATTATVFRNTSAGSPLSFTTTTLNTGATNYVGGAIGDVDGDGKPDLVLVNSTGNVVSVFRNTSTGTTISFAGKVNYTTGATPSSVVFGDFDGNGKLDIAVANKGANTISVLLNTSTARGSVSYAAPVTFAVGTAPADIAAGDIDGDGKPDLIISNSGSDNISVLRNNTTVVGNVVFDAAVNFATGTNPAGIAIGDLNNDGAPDIAVLNATSNTVSVFTNTSTSGNVALVKSDITSFGTRDLEGHLAIGDLDGDAKPDLAVGTNDGSFVCLKNISTSVPVFKVPVDIPTGNGPTDIAIADFDGDGKPDLANIYGNTADVFHNEAELITILALSPSSGIAGNTLSIIGANFNCITAAKINGVSASIISSTSSLITVTVPVSTSGPVTVETATGAAAVSPGKYTYVGPPANLKYDSTVIVVNSGAGSLDKDASFDDGASTTITFSIQTNALGITIHSGSGKISWPASLPIGNYDLLVTATNQNGNTTAHFKLTVLPLPPDNLVYNPDNYTTTFGTAGASNAPTVNWNNQTGTFAIISTPVAGITIDPVTGIISWNNAVPIGIYKIAVTATNTGGTSASDTVTLTVKQPAPTNLIYTPSSRSAICNTADSSTVPGVNWNGETGTFSITNTGLPAGITINATTGVISWSTAVPLGTYIINVVAQNSGGNSTPATFTLTLNTAKADFSYSQPSYSGTYGTAGAVNAAVLNWHCNTGTIAIAPSTLPVGITVNNAGRLTWTNTVPAGTYTITLTASNTGGDSTVTVTLNIAAKLPSAFSYNPADSTVTFGNAANSVVPSINWGGQNGTFSISTTGLPAGITINATTGVISWTGTVPAGTYNLTIKAANSVGSVTTTYSIIVNPDVPTNLVYAGSPYTTDFGTAGNSGTPTVNWHGETGTFNNGNAASLPGGISVNINTGVITWNNTVPVGTYTINITAVNSAGPSVAFAVILKVLPLLPTNLNYTGSPYTGTYTVAGNSATPTINWGGEAGSFFITNSASLPSGITIVSGTGILKWSNTVPVGTYTINVIGTNSKGNSNVYAYTLIIAPKAPSGFSYTPSVMDATFTIAGNSVTPAITWSGQAGSFTITSAGLPAGITIDGTTGIISWNNTVPIGTYTITVKATNSAGSQQTTYTLRVKPGLPSAPVYAGNPYVADFGTTGSSAVPTINWGGEAGSFAITTTGLPTGITIDATTGKISWSNTVPVGTYTINVVATNSTGTSTATTVTLTVNAVVPVIVSYAGNPFSGTYGLAGNSVLPTVNWGGESGTFAVTSTLPTGFTFNTTNGRISWNGIVPVATYTVDVVAKNSKGQSVVYTVTIKINPKTPANFSYSPSTVAIQFGITGVSVVPTIDWNGESGTFAIVSTGLPAGITIDASTGVLTCDGTVPIGTYGITVSATNSTGSVTTTYAFNVKPGIPTNLVYTPSGATVIYGTGASSNIPTVNWNGEVGTFAITSTGLPAGITINATTGKITWTGTLLAGIYNINVVAKNSSGSSTPPTVFVLTVKPLAPTGTMYAPNDKTQVIYGNTGKSVTPVIDWGGEAGTFTITNAVDAGISIDNKTGVISWGSTVALGVHTIQVKATNSAGSITATYQLTVVVGAPTNLVYNPNNKTVNITAVAGNSATPTVNWHGETGNFSISNAASLPAAITINATTGVISWNNTLTVGTYVVKATAANSAGSITVNYTITVVAGPTALSYSKDTYITNFSTPGSSVSPTVGWGGETGTFLIGSNPAGVTIDPVTGIVSWNDNVAVGTYTMTVTAKNSGGSITTTIKLIVNALPTASITGGKSICAGESDTLLVSLTGKQPWSFTYTDGTTPVTVSNISADKYTIVVKPYVTTTYSVLTVTDGNATDIPVSSYTIATLYDLPTAEIKSSNKTMQVCTGESLVLTANDGASYKWSTGETTQSITVKGSGTFNVSVTNKFGCIASSTDAVVKVNPAPTGKIDHAAKDTICIGSTVSLTATGGDTYQWYVDNAAITGATTDTYKADAKGNYTVQMISTNGCKAFATGAVDIYAVKKPAADFDFDKYCTGIVTAFNNKTIVPMPTGNKYQWYFGDNTTSTNINPTHTYTDAKNYLVVLIATSDKCPLLGDTLSKMIAVQAPEVNKAYEPINAVIGKKEQLSARNIGAIYTWSPANAGLDNNKIQSPTLVPATQQTFTVKIENAAGCVVVDTLLVRVFKRNEIFVPKAFTPNNDGQNDRLFPFLVGIRELHYFRVFNRWGALVYESKEANNASVGWDGKYKGLLQPMEGYVWVAEAIDVDGNLIKQSGNTLLIR